ncbi:CD151 antigen-like [Sinocyclocheilus grahami]|uniref:CD151 antigen-like n=1 Tax=Sinocyclocheilus grahami TaxID=75366 RepID=UPI0007AD463A|nr:PREDICTED: CD151 antigen-like [Sinocyclocheilus grahami]
MADAEEKINTCGTICLKYLLFIFNLFFWLAGGAVMAVGLWTLVDKSDYISLLSSSTYSAAAFILIGAGAVVVLTGILGCCATIREQRGLLVVVREHYGQIILPKLCNLMHYITNGCGVRDHPSNIYKVEGGCISKLEEFILQHLIILGSVGLGIAFIQIVGMIFTCCLYQSLKEEIY